MLLVPDFRIAEAKVMISSSRGLLSVRCITSSLSLLLLLLLLLILLSLLLLLSLSLSLLLLSFVSVIAVVVHLSFFIFSTFVISEFSIKTFLSSPTSIFLLSKTTLFFTLNDSVPASNIIEYFSDSRTDLSVTSLEAECVVLEGKVFCFASVINFSFCMLFSLLL